MKQQQPLTISYLRFSTPEQLKGDSHRRQTDLAAEYCQRHGLTLTDRLSDLGVSAFRGMNLKSGLADFLDHVRRGDIPKGSTLLVEELDRLSRQNPEDAIGLFLDIVRSGVKIVTLNTGDCFEKGKIDMGKLMIATVKFCTANDESVKKSFRLGAAWEQKRRRIKDRPLTKILPYWLRLENGKIVVNEAKAAIVRRIFKMAIAGSGLNAITKTLNAETQGIGKAKFFHRSYISKILHAKAVFGEFQPHKLTHDGLKRRTPVGDPISDYFPVVVSETDFYAAQKAMSSRKNASGPQTDFVNLLAGLLYCDDGSSLQIQNKGFGRRYVSSAALLGLQGHSSYVGFPVQALETAVLQTLARPGLFGKNNAADELQTEIAAAEAKLKEIAGKITAVQNLLLTGQGQAESVVELLGKLDAQKQVQKRRLADLKATHATSTQPDVGDEYFEFIARQQQGELTKDERLKFRAILQRLVERIDCRLTRQYRDYWADAAITMKSGEMVNLTIAATRQEDKTYRVTVYDETNLGPAKIVKPNRARREAARHLPTDFSVYPQLITARCTRSMDSFTAVWARPTTVVFSSPCTATSTSTSHSSASMPNRMKE